MTVYYKTNEAWPGINFPVLHRVVYAKTVDGVMAMYQRSYKDYLVDAWLETNCQHPYYHSPGYLREKFIEFECDEDAAMFALSCV
jgi:hypothetical protein